MNLFGPVVFGARLGLGDQRLVAGDRLAGGASGDDANQRAEILQAGHDLLDTGHRDVYSGKGCGESNVPFIFNEQERAGFRHQKIRAADPQFGLCEAGSKFVPSDFGQSRGIIGHGSAEYPSQKISDLASSLVNRRGKNVRGRFLRELHDPLAEVGLDRHNSGVDQSVIQSDFLRDHRLRLHRESSFVLDRNVENDGAC